MKNWVLFANGSFYIMDKILAIENTLAAFDRPMIGATILKKANRRKILSSNRHFYSSPLATRKSIEVVDGTFSFSKNIVALRRPTKHTRWRLIFGWWYGCRSAYLNMVAESTFALFLLSPFIPTFPSSIHCLPSTPHFCAAVGKEHHLQTISLMLSHLFAAYLLFLSTRPDLVYTCARKMSELVCSETKRKDKEVIIITYETRIITWVADHSKPIMWVRKR